MADDYAEMIRAEFGEPVDLLGVSTGGSIAQQFAADPPELAHRHWDDRNFSNSSEA